MSEGRSRDLPLNTGLGHIVKLHDEDGQTIDDAQGALSQIEGVDNCLAQPMRNRLIIGARSRRRLKREHSG